MARANATDPNEDGLTFDWSVSAGRLMGNGLRTTQWQTPEQEGVHYVRVRARDEHGAVAEALAEILVGTTLTVDGVVMDESGEPIEGAQVDINGVSTVTDDEGRYVLHLPPESANTTVFTTSITKAGHMPVYATSNSAPGGNGWAMGSATSQQFPSNTAINLRDSNSGCKPPYSSLIEWSRHSDARVPRRRAPSGAFEVVDAAPELRDAIDFVIRGGLCPPGAAISIPADALMDPTTGTQPSSVDITIGTVDLTSAGSMPGNRAVEGGRYMISVGAAVVEASAGGQPLQLKADTKAELSVPATCMSVGESSESSRFATRCGKPPTDVRLLVFDPSTGIWKDLEAARYDAKTNSFAAAVPHFSEFNMDLIKDNPGCLRIDSSAIAGPFALDVVVPDANPFLAPTYIHREVANPPGDQIHAFFNLPPDSDLGIIAMRKEDSTTCPGDQEITPLGVFVGTTGSGVPGGFGSGSLSPPYDQCGPMTVLSDVASGTSIVRNGAGVAVGWHTAVFAAFADPTAGELMPLDGVDTCNFHIGGQTNCSVIGIMDSGSTRTRVQSVSPHRLVESSYGDTDAVLLSIADESVLDVRVNGLLARSGGVIPESAGSAQLEQENLRIDVPPDLDLTLIGTDFIRNAVYHVDYTNPLTSIPEITGAAAVADVTLFTPDSTSIPTAEIVLTMDPFPALGSPQPPRFYLRNVEFKNGCNSAYGQPSPAGNDYLFMVDTGSTVTVINDQIAADLGLSLGPGDTHTGAFDCYESGDNKGYAITEFNALGADGTYTVENAVVCWDASRIEGSAFGQPIDGIVGSNLFNEVEIIFDGSNSTLGIRQ